MTLKFGQRVVRVGCEGATPLRKEGTVMQVMDNGFFVVQWDTPEDGEEYNLTEFYPPSMAFTIVSPKSCTP